ncbi:Transcription elongation factor SPT4 [Toxocara canis]|uniref:Transcription elongation factor SPT4 n=1 Tax=Toxocara canis TaxID=6265 RepID=A0A0B2W4V8_TOXCA|nr:Transcription elongation factor SPT4 [Toxocara canis]
MVWRVNDVERQEDLSAGRVDDHAVAGLDCSRQQPPWAKGMYAISVSGTLPSHIVQELKAQNVRYKPNMRDMTFSRVDDHAVAGLDCSRQQPPWMISNVPCEPLPIEEASGGESGTNERGGDEPASKKRRGTNSSTEADLISVSVKADEENELKRLMALRDNLSNKLRYNGSLRDIPLDRLALDESIQVRPLNNVYVEELERCMSEELWDWKKTVFTVFVRNNKTIGRPHLKYVIQDGSHRFRALLQLRSHDPTRQVPKSISCRVYEELTLEECVLLRHSQNVEDNVALPLTIRDMATIVRRHLMRLGYTFSSAVKLYVKGVDAIRLLLPTNAPGFVIRMGCSCSVLYSACMRLLECFSAGNIKLSPSEMANCRPIYRFDKTEMFDLGRRSFWHAVLIGYNKEPKRVLDIIEEVIGNRSSISEAEQALRFFLDPLSEIVARMGVSTRREALEQIFGNADIDDSVIQTVLSDEKIRDLCRSGSSISISELHTICTTKLAEVAAASRRTQSANDAMIDGMELIAEIPLSDPAVDERSRGLNLSPSTADSENSVAGPSHVIGPNNLRTELDNTAAGADFDIPAPNDTENAIPAHTLVTQRSRRASRKRCSTDSALSVSSKSSRVRRSVRVRPIAYRTRAKRTSMPTAPEAENSHGGEDRNGRESEQSDSSQDTQSGAGAMENVHLETGSGEEEAHIEAGWIQARLLNRVSLDDLTETLEKEFICRSHNVIGQFMQCVNRAALSHKSEMARKVAVVIGELPTSTAEQLLAELKALPKADN